MTFAFSIKLVLESKKKRQVTVSLKAYLSIFAFF